MLRNSRRKDRFHVLCSPVTSFSPLAGVKHPFEGKTSADTKNHREVLALEEGEKGHVPVQLRGEKARRERKEGETEKERGRVGRKRRGTLHPPRDDNSRRHGNTSEASLCQSTPAPHKHHPPSTSPRPLPLLLPSGPLLEPPFRESTRNSYRSADEFEVLRILRGVLLTTGSFLPFSLSLSLSPSPLLFIFLFFPRFFTSLLLPPSVSTPPRGFSLFSPSSSSLFRERGVLFSYSLSTPPSPSASYQESRVIGSRRPVFASTFAARVPSRDLRQRRTSRRVENFFSFDRDAFSA